MATTLTFDQEVYDKLGLATTATADQVIAALDTALAKPKRSEIKAAAAPPLSEADQAYEAVWGDAAPGELSAGATAAYQDVWPD